MFNLFSDAANDPYAAKPIEMDPGVAIFLSLLVMVIMAGLIVLLYWRIRGERKRLALQKSRGEGGISVSDFNEVIKHKCKNENAPFSVWQIIIPNRKNMLDSYGTTQYDRAFKELVERIKKAYPSSARFASNEEGSILILMSGRHSEENLKQLAAAAIIQCNQGVRLSENMTMSFDVNVAIVEHNESNKTFEQIDNNMQHTLAQSQRTGINQYSIHSPDISDTESEEYKTYVEIKSAIENKEFLLYYQQINDLVTGDTAGYEALLRWNHRTLGVLPPSTFLNILDVSGDINWVGVWAFEQMLNQHAIWSKYFDKKFYVSMNLSAKQLMNDKLVAELRHVLKKYKVFAGDVCMEIAEYAFLQSGIIAENIEKLSQAGFLIAVDNYGMEMNITALDKFKIDIIKIERQFITKAVMGGDDDKMSKELLKLVVSYTQRRNIKLVAEGVEDEGVMSVLRDSGIRYGQGYYFGKPVAPEEIKFIE